MQGRGAKGSIKDRLISMLYRFRYKKKELKEEDYKVDKKEKQVTYLNNLKDFKETENVNNLEDLDRQRLDDIKFDVNYKVNKKGIDQVELTLDSVEYKSSELDETVNIKKEIKKTKEEVTILKEVNKFINDSKELLTEIDNDIDNLKKEVKNKNQDLQPVEEKYNKLKEKVEKLNKQFDAVKNKYDLSEFKIIESIKLVNSIENYNTLASLNEMEMLVHVCAKEIDKIAKVEVEVVKQKKVGADLETSKKDQIDIKIKFKKNKEKVNSLDSVSQKIEYELKEQERIINSMYEQASYLKENIRKETEIIGHRHVLSSILNIAGGILTLPFTGRNILGVALGATMINRGVRELNRKLETREKTIVKYDYEDITERINKVKDKVEYTNLIISDSLNEVQKLKVNYIKTFKGYDNILVEYLDVFEKIANIENNLKLMQKKISDMDKTLNKEKEMNKEKLKKIK